MLGDKLQELRMERNLTIRDVSRLTGLGSNTISRWENDKVLPKLQHLSVLAAFYGVSMDELHSAAQPLMCRMDALEKRVQRVERVLGGGRDERSPRSQG